MNYVFNVILLLFAGFIYAAVTVSYVQRGDVKSLSFY